MAIDIRFLPAFFSGDADFRQWGAGIAAQLAAIGLVKAADTGQIDWTTVLRPTANLYAGYEIWRFNDSLQATLPVFIKIEYGVGNLLDRLALRVQVSTSTNGAGTPTGQLGTQTTLSYLASRVAGSTAPSFCSGDASRLNLVTNWDQTSGFFMVVLVERTKTQTMVNTADGIVTAMTIQSAAVRYQVIPILATPPTQVNGNMAAPFSPGASSALQSFAVSPTLAPLGQPFFASWVAYSTNDMTAAVPVQVDHLGGLHMMMPLACGQTSAGWAQGTALATNGVAILWE